MNMKRLLLLAAAMLTLGGLGAWATTTFSSVGAPSTAVGVAATRTTTFAIRNMTCALCPVTVGRAMKRVDGVMSVAVDFGAKTATVVFDPSVTNADAIAAGSTNAGYPASVGG